ncbi:MAG: ArgE/DapE family deacylase [Firmicutes bacterium]|nr:ArgE/DapE family deacylase [Bacillota bacterium]
MLRQVEARLLEAVDDGEVLKLAREMVRIPSENPPGRVADMARYVLSFLEGLGVVARTVEPEPGRVNVLASLGSGSGRAGLVFNGHLDVVPAGPGWTVDPYGGMVQGGRLWGRGSADMKGGLAAILGAVAALVRAKVAFERPVALMFTCDEETGGKLGAGYLVRNGYVSGDMCVVCEPSGLRLIHAEGGLCWMTITTHGRSAHSVLAWRGVNAVEKMVQVLSALAPLQRELGAVRNASGKRVVLSANVIRGGVKVNQVPDACEALLDLRIPAGVDLSAEQVLDRIRAVLADLKMRDPELRVELSHGDPVTPFEVPPDAPVIGLVKEAYRDVTGQECAPWSPREDPPTDDSDLYHLWTAGGIPGVYFGPGEIEQAHVADEFVEIEQLRQAARIYALLAYRTCAKGGGVA